MLFDELHYLDTSSKYYISFKKSAEIYVEAAQEIRRANSNVPIGGPAGSLGWENGHWGNYVIQEPGGKELLDFIAANVFLIWSPYETDETIMERTIWYEETAKKIKSMMGDDCPETLVLGAYNVNGLWQLNGEPWTDPRNTNYFGGIYHALAKLHSAKGNWDITLHWDLLGGYGIFQWFPDYNENPNYYVWKFLNTYGELVETSQLVECVTSEAPMDSVLHHSGMNVNAYGLQPFAIKNESGEINLVLVNKTTDMDTAQIHITESSQHCIIYQLNENNFDQEQQPIAMHNIKSDYEEIVCPSMSITVVQLRDGIIAGIDDEIVRSSFELEQNYPNPFNASTIIQYQMESNDHVSISIYDENGKLVDNLINEHRAKGNYEVNWKPNNISSGIYFCRMKTSKINKTIKLLYLK